MLSPISRGSEVELTLLITLQYTQEELTPSQRVIIRNALLVELRSSLTVTIENPLRRYGKHCFSGLL